VLHYTQGREENKYKAAMANIRKEALNAREEAFSLVSVLAMA
jgi:hypothetical protein